MSDDLPNLKSILAEALELGSPEQRAAYLDEACRGNAAARARVEQLLAAFDKAGSFMQQPAVVAATSDYAPVQERPGTMIGPYKLMEQIGEGGFGLVFVAEQQGPVRRRVAIKIIKPGMDTRDVVARFEAERQALAMMDHPNIAKVLDAGATESGRPYFVMELVRGVPITTYCDQQQLTLRERLDLFGSVCHAIQHAHQKGIIHRDIKPSNVLVTLHDSRPVVKVIDFGVAKALNQQLAQQTVYTRFMQMIGTPLYMSPEQAEMSGLDIDTRSDIYSLGVLLYELLTGSLPIERERLAAAAFDELRRIIREEEPPRPSLRLSQSGDRLASIAAQRRSEPARLSKLIRGDLDWIVMRALEKDRSRRYESAGSFAADVQRYLDDQPVEACPPSLAYRLRKFVRRNMTTVGSVVTVAAALVLGTAISVWQAVRATNAERSARANQYLALRGEEQARRAAESEKAAREAETEQREQAEEARAKTAEEAEKVLAEAALKRRHLYAAQLLAAQRALEKGFLPTAVALLRRQQEEDPDDKLRSFEWHYLWRQCHTQRMEIDVECGTVMGLRYAPDGKTLFPKGANYNLYCWNVASGRALWTVRSLGVRGAEDLVISGDPPMLLSRDMLGVVQLNSVTGEQNAAYKPENVDKHSQFVGPDSKTMLIAPQSGKRQMINVADGSVQREYDVPKDFAWTFTPDGKYMVGANNYDAPAIAIVDMASGDVKQTPIQKPENWIHSIAASPDAKRAVIGAWHYDLQWWVEKRDGNSVSIQGQSQSGGGVPLKEAFLIDLASGEVIQKLSEHYRGLSAVAFSADGSLIATASRDTGVRLWDGLTGDGRGLVGWHTDGATALAFSPDGAELATGGQDGKIKFWPLKSHDRTVVGPSAKILDIAISPDGKLVAATGRATGSDVPGAVWLIDVATGEVRHKMDEERLGTSVAFHPTRPILAWASEQFVQLWDLEKSEKIDRLELIQHSPGAVRFTPDGKWLIASGTTGFNFWDTTTRMARPRIECELDWYVWPVISPQGDRLAIATWDKAETILFSLPDGERAAPIGNRWDRQRQGVGGGIGDHTAKGAFSPDGQIFAAPARASSMGAATRIDLISLADQKIKLTLRGESDDYLCVAWSPDGRTIATGTRDGTILFWDPVTGEQRLRLEAHRNQISSLEFSKDGSLLVSGAWDGSVASHRTGAR